MKLYILPTCPYCQHVLQFVKDNGVNIDIVEVPGDHTMRRELREASGQTYVPTLVDGDTLIADDDEKIIEYLRAATQAA